MFFSRTLKMARGSISSVAWVNSWWLVVVGLCLLAVVLVAALVRTEAGGAALLALITGAALLLTYPYIHYRVYEGKVQRIPPRFIPTGKGKPFLSKNYL